MVFSSRAQYKTPKPTALAMPDTTEARKSANQAQANFKA